MKSNLLEYLRSAKARIYTALFLLPASLPLSAANGTWNGGPLAADALWSNVANWGGALSVPGTGDIATFNNGGNSFTTIDLGAGVTVGTIGFDSAAAAAYIIGAGAVGSQTLTLNTGGFINIASTVVNNQLINAAVVLGTAGDGTITLDNDSTTNSLTVAGGITGGGTGAKTLAVTGEGATTLSGIIGNGGGTVGITKSGAGTLTLTANNSFTGNVQINGGTLQVSNIAAIANALGTGAATVTLNGGTLDLRSDANTNYNRAATVTADSAILVGVITAENTARDYTLASLSIGAHTLRVENNGTANASTTDADLVINGATTLTGNVNFNVVNAGDGTTMRLTGAVDDGAGNLSLTKSGDGVLEINNAANTFDGGLFINDGTVIVAAAANIGTGGLTLNGGTIRVQSVGLLTGKAVTTAGADAKTFNYRINSDSAFDLGALTLGGTGTLTLSVQRISGDGNISVSINDALSLTGSLALTSTNSATGVTTLVIDSAITQASGTGNVTIGGGGVVRLNTAADYNGLTDIDLGTLRLGIANAVPSGVGKGDLTFSPDVAAEVARLDLNGLNQTINGLSTSGAHLGSSIIDNTAAGAVTLTIGANNGSGTFGSGLGGGGTIQDTGGDLTLTKTGSGAIILGGINTYAGATNVNGGFLGVNSAGLANTSVVNVGTSTSAATLGFVDGTGGLTTLANNVNLNLGGGTNIGGLLFQLGANTAASDRLLLQGTGALTVGAAGGLINAQNLGTMVSGISYDLITGPNAIVGFGSLNLGTLPGGFTYALTNTGGGTAVTLTPTTAVGANLFWTGNSATGANTSWATLAGGDSNWATDLAGTEGGFTPGSGQTVNFSATTSGNYSTTLDNIYSIAGLNVLSGGGTVTIAQGNVFGALTIGTGGIDIDASAPALTTISAPVALGAAQTWNLDSGRTLDVSGVLSGSGNLNVAGGGTVNLTGTNTFTGNLIVDGVGSTLTYNAGAALNIGVVGAQNYTVSNGGTLRLTAAATVNPTATSLKSFVIGTGGGTLNVADAAGILTLDDANQFSGAGNFIKTGDGLLMLGNAYTGYTGTTVTVNGGQLRLQNTQALGTTGAQADISLAAGATLHTRINTTNSDFDSDVTVTGDASLIVNRTTGGGGVTHLFGNLSIGAQTLTVQAGTSVTSGTMTARFDGLTLSGSSTFDVQPGATGATQLLILGNVTESSAGRSLTKDGGGLLTINGASSFTGGIVINAGTLRGVGQTPAAGAPTVDPFGANTITLNGGTLQVRDQGDGTGTGINMDYNNAIIVNGNATINVDQVTNTPTDPNDHVTRFGHLTINNGAILTTNGLNGYNITFNSSGANISTLLSNATFNVTTDVTTLSNAGSTTSGTNVSLTDGALSFGLTKTGGGTLLLGRTTIDGVLTADGGTLQLNSAGNLLPGGIVVNSGTLLVNAANGVLGAGTSPDVQVNGGSVQIRNGAGAQAVGLDYLANANLQLLNNASTIFQVESLDIANTATQFTLNVNRTSGSGTGFTSTFQGPITTNGTLQFNTTGGNGYQAVINSSSTVTLGGNISFNPTTANLTIAGNISDDASTYSLTKIGAGTLTLNGTNDYDGPTDVDVGTLIINGDNSASSGALTVDGGATLGGTGTIGGATTISGFHSPGNSPGIQTFNSGLSYTGATINWELYGNTATMGDRGSPTGWDGINVTGALSFDASTTFNLNFGTTLLGSSVDWSDTLWGSGQQWLVYSGTVAPTGLPTLNVIDWQDAQGDFFLLVRAGSFFELETIGNNVYLNYVPEPSRAMLLLLGLLSLGFRRRRAV